VERVENLAYLQEKVSQGKHNERSCCTYSGDWGREKKVA